LTTPGEVRATTVPTFVAKATDAAPTRASVRVPPGDYFLVLDHSGSWGDTSPSKNTLPARVDYLIQTGEEDTK
jgi:hypothetical protein